MKVTRVECALGAGTLSLETGKIAKQAHGAVVARLGDTMVLAAAVEGSPIPGRDFFPLTVDYREKVQSAGKFPGGYIKREGRPTTKETLTSRLIDRPIRPLFPAHYISEVQVMVQTLSADKVNDPDVIGMIAASAALYISKIPFQKPIAGVRVGRVDGKLIVMPTHQDMEHSDLDLIVSGTAKDVAMIEGFARELPEDVMAEAIAFAHKHIKAICELIEELRAATGAGKKPEPEPAPANPLIKILYDKHNKDVREAKLTVAKLERYKKVADLKKEIKARYFPEGKEPEYTEAQFSGAWGAMEDKVFRDIILAGKRIDGRGFKEIRALYCEVGLLPRTHGSSLFQRGETQALVTATLGTAGDEQKVEGLEGEYSKKFMLDYNFPPYSVGECKPIRGPGRREIGHGMLAERSLKAVLPDTDKFPYTIRLVSDITESNGSSSMASVCGGTLCLMDAGVPIRNPVAGISIGLVKEEDEFVLFTDIQGDEDHYGDMDFKIAGTQRGITGIQLDLKLEGIGHDIIEATLQQAKAGRIEILKTMLASLRMPRKEISPFAPRLLTIKINPEKIGALIGPGGKNIKGIQEATGAKIDIEDDGTVYIAHSDAAGAQAAKLRVEAITEEVKIGKVYEGKVISIKDFGAFVEIMPGRDGLVHISELDTTRVGRVDDVCRVGDVMRVVVIDIDNQDRVKLSRKALLEGGNGGGGGGAGETGGGEGGRDGGDRGGDRGGRGGRGGDRSRRRD